MSAQQPGGLVPAYEAAAGELVRIWKQKNDLNTREREGWSDHFDESPYNTAAAIINAAFPAIVAILDASEATS